MHSRTAAASTKKLSKVMTENSEKIHHKFLDFIVGCPLATRWKNSNLVFWNLTSLKTKKMFSPIPFWLFPGCQWSDGKNHQCFCKKFPWNVFVDWDYDKKTKQLKTVFDQICPDMLKSAELFLVILVNLNSFEGIKLEQFFIWVSTSSKKNRHLEVFETSWACSSGYYGVWFQKRNFQASFHGPGKKTITKKWSFKAFQIVFMKVFKKNMGFLGTPHILPEVTEKIFWKHWNVSVTLQKRTGFEWKKSCSLKNLKFSKKRLLLAFY